MFNSPIDYCPVCKQMVALDQTQFECAREHDCEPGTVCPLLKYFTRIDPGAGRPEDIPQGKGG